MWVLAVGVGLLVVKYPWDVLKGWLEMGRKVAQEKLSS
jgi:hypothetical protein